MKELGIVTMEYDKEGNMIPSLSSFNSSIQVKVSDIQDQLKKVYSSNDPNMEYNASLILSHFFSEVTNAELADREKFTLRSEIVSCETFPEGGVKKCVIKFALFP